MTLHDANAEGLLAAFYNVCVGGGGKRGVLQGGGGGKGEISGQVKFF